MLRVCMGDEKWRWKGKRPIMIEVAARATSVDWTAVQIRWWAPSEREREV